MKKILLISIIFTITISLFIIKYKNTFKILHVLTGSMYPEIKIGESILIKKSLDYQIGDIITYKTKENLLITHRIVNIQDDLYYTKGDNNDSIDNEPIKYSQICGKVIFKYKLPLYSRNKTFSLYRTNKKIRVESRK